MSSKGTRQSSKSCQSAGDKKRKLESLIYICTIYLHTGFRRKSLIYICAIYLHTGFRRIARLAILTPLKSSSNPTDSVHVHICVCVCTTLCLCSNPTDSVYACMCMCVPVCNFNVTGVGKRSHLSVPTLMVLLLACLSVRKWHCFEQHFIPCPLLSLSGLSAPIWSMFEKMSVSLLLSYLGIALIKLFGELLPGLLVFGLLHQVPEMLDLPLQQRLQVGLCLLHLHQDLIVGVVLHLFLLRLQDSW